MTVMRTVGTGLGVSRAAVSLLVNIVLAIAGTTTGRRAAASTTVRALFVFGDSYADNGNGQKDTIGFHKPYGITWPGYPTGRASSGHIQTDFLATQALGISSPPPYALVKNSPLSIAHGGINFAVGGAGVTRAFGTPSVGTQVGWFESLVSAGSYSSDALASSVTFLALSGNDYVSFKGSLKEQKGIMDFTNRVVELVEQNLRRLYGLRARNIIVTTLAPLNCLPRFTIATNYTTCSRNALVAAVNSRHDILLEKALIKLKEDHDLPGLNFLLLQQGAALKRIQKRHRSYSITVQFRQCCEGHCGSLDPEGGPLYTVCDEPESHLFWDAVHPTETGWKYVIQLYLKDQEFTKFAPTLRYWVDHLS